MDSNKGKGRVMSQWYEDREYPVRDWQHEVANDDTRLGYRDWVNDQRQDRRENEAES